MKMVGLFENQERHHHDYEIKQCFTCYVSFILASGFNLHDCDQGFVQNNSWEWNFSKLQWRSICSCACFTPVILISLASDWGEVSTGKTERCCFLDVFHFTNELPSFTEWAIVYCANVPQNVYFLSLNIIIYMYCIEKSMTNLFVCQNVIPQIFLSDFDVVIIHLLALFTKSLPYCLKSCWGKTKNCGGKQEPCGVGRLHRWIGEYAPRLPTRTWFE